jgi:hypothetical protein
MPITAKKLDYAPAATSICAASLLPCAATKLAVVHCWLLPVAPNVVLSLLSRVLLDRARTPCCVFLGLDLLQELLKVMHVIVPEVAHTRPAQLGTLHMRPRRQQHTQ